MTITSVGTVSEWYPDRGWGVIDAPDVPSPGRFGESALWAVTFPLSPGESILVGDQGWFVVVGETVDFDWEPVEQDGFAVRATSVRPRRDPTVRTVQFRVDGRRQPWPTDRFGPIPHPGFWSESGEGTGS